MPDVNDYGMKISRQGYDVTTCSDNQLLWSSSFRLPVIIQSGTYSITDETSTQTIHTHNLGYVPLFFMQRRVTAGNPQYWSFAHTTGNGDGGAVYVDTTKIWYNANGLGDPTKITFFIFNANIETAYTASIVDSDDDVQGAVSNDYGFKVSKEGSDVTSAGLADLQSFSGSSLAGIPVRHQIIHKIGTGSLSGSLFTVAHGLGYRPMFLFYTKHGSDGYYCNPSHYSSDLTERIRTYADTTNIYLKNGSGATLPLAYVIFKDPLI